MIDFKAFYLLFAMQSFENSLIIIKMGNILGYIIHNKQIEDISVSLWKCF